MGLFYIFAKTILLIMDIDSLKQNGFEGFLSIKSLRENPYKIPLVKGVYVVLYLQGIEPSFLETGTGGFFKGKDPNVSRAELRENWVEGADVIYIGKAGGTASNATLRSRLTQYLKFGNGKNIGHWGGRYIWQIENADNLKICWKPIMGEPSDIESEMIEQFKHEHMGKRPFANLKD